MNEKKSIYKKVIHRKIAKRWPHESNDGHTDLIFSTLRVKVCWPDFWLGDRKQRLIFYGSQSSERTQVCNKEMLYHLPQTDRLL